MTEPSALELATLWGIVLCGALVMSRTVAKNRVHRLLVVASIVYIIGLGLIFWFPWGSPPLTRPDPVAAFVAELMQPRTAAFVVPSPIGRGEPAEAIFRIGPPTIDPEELQQQLQRLAGRSSTGASGTVGIAPRMVASLIADRECVITPRTPLDQAVSFADIVDWRWVVTPKVGGKLRLTVTLSAPIDVNGHETSYLIKTFERTVTVEVSNRNRLADLLRFAKDYWVILVALAGGLVAGGRWLLRRQWRRSDSSEQQ